MIDNVAANRVSGHEGGQRRGVQLPHVAISVGQDLC